MAAILKHLDMCGGGRSSVTNEPQVVSPHMTGSHAMAMQLLHATIVPQPAGQQPTRQLSATATSELSSLHSTGIGAALLRKRSSLNSAMLLKVLGFDSESGPQAGLPSTIGGGRDPPSRTESKHSGYLHMTLGRQLCDPTATAFPGGQEEAGLCRPQPSNASVGLQSVAARDSPGGAATGADTSGVHGRWARLRAGALAAAAPPHSIQQPAPSTRSDAQLPRLDLGSSVRFLPAFASHSGNTPGGRIMTGAPTAADAARISTLGNGGAASLSGINSGGSANVHPSDFMSMRDLIQAMMGSQGGGSCSRNHGGGTVASTANTGISMLNPPPSIHRTISGASSGGRGGISCSGASGGVYEPTGSCSDVCPLLQQDVPAIPGLGGAAGMTPVTLPPPAPDHLAGEAMLMREFRFLTDMLSSAHPSAESGGSSGGGRQQLPLNNCQQGMQVSPFAMLVGRLSTIAEVAINSGPLSSISPSASLHILSNNAPFHRGMLSSGRPEAPTEDDASADGYSDSLVADGIMGSEMGTRSSGLLRDGGSGSVRESRLSQPAPSSAYDDDEEVGYSDLLLSPHATNGGGGTGVVPAVDFWGDAYMWSGSRSSVEAAHSASLEQRAAWAQVGHLCMLLGSQQQLVTGGASEDHNEAAVGRGMGGGTAAGLLPGPPPALQLQQMGPSEPPEVMDADGQQLLLAKQLLALLRRLLIPQLGPIGE